MSDTKKAPLAETSSPARNFTIRLEDRVRALGGPPAYVRRRKTIEDILDATERGLRGLYDRLRKREPTSDIRAEFFERGRTQFTFHELNRLIDNHNRYYPAEADLPMHRRTGALLERGGEPWRPMPRISLEDVMTRIFDECESAASTLT